MCGVCFARDKEKSGWPCGTPDCGGNKRSERAGRDFPLFWRQVGAQMRCGACVFFCMSPFSLCVAALAKKRTVGRRPVVCLGVYRATPRADRRPRQPPCPTHTQSRGLFSWNFYCSFSPYLCSREKRGQQAGRAEREGRKRWPPKRVMPETRPRDPRVFPLGRHAASSVRQTNGVFSFV